MTDPLTQLVAFAVGVLGVARAVRLLTSDNYPPVAALRRWWWNQTVGKGGWREGWHPVLVGDEADKPGCPFCCAPYVTAVALAVAVWAGIWSPDLGSLAGWWWVLAIWAAGSYVAAMVVVRDEPPPVDP